MIREYRIGDEKAIAEIEKVCFSSPWSETAILESAESGTRFTVLESNGTVAGYAGLQVIVPEGFVTNIAVLPEYRGQGYGGMLVESLKEIAKERRLHFISLEVRRSNDEAVSLYKKHGFEEVGIRKNFYTSPLEDAIIMTLKEIG